MLSCSMRAQSAVDCCCCFACTCWHRSRPRQLTGSCQPVPPLTGIVGPDGRGLEHCHLAERRDRSHAETGPSNNGSHKRRRSENGGMGAPSSKGNGARHDAVRRALTVGFANRIARRMRLHNGYKTMAEHGQLAQLHPSSANLATDEDGLLPEWVIYHEFVATSRPFLRQVGGMGFADMCMFDSILMLASPASVQPCISLTMRF